MADHQVPRAVEWFVSNPQYTLLKIWGNSIYREKEGIEAFVSLFPDRYSADVLAENSRKYNLENAYSCVKEYFDLQYGYQLSSELISKYNRMLNSLHNGKEEKKFIYIDELLQFSIVYFLTTMFIWDWKREDAEAYGICFKHILGLMNQVCIFGDAPSDRMYGEILSLLGGDTHIADLAESCFWTIITFTLAHEAAHEYMGTMKSPEQRIPSDQAGVKEEFMADGIAYDMVLRNIMGEGNAPFRLENFTYLAPMMYMDFFDLYYYTDRVLYKKYVVMGDHPTPAARKNALFKTVQDDKYDFDTEEGNDLYNCFLNAYDLYKDELLLKEQRGKLKPATFTDRRNRMEE